MGHYNRREAQFRADGERQRKAMKTVGHDEDAAMRAAQVKATVETAEQFEGEFASLVRRIALERIETLRAQGPVGCTCGHPICVESSVKPDQAELLIQRFQNA